MPLPAFFYTPAVPLGPQQKNVSQPIMEANFQAINELITQDHVGFNQNNFGFHNKVTLTTQVAPPNFFGLSGFFSAVNATTGKLDTFVAAFTQAGLPVFPLTSSILSTVAAPLPNSLGWAYLPNGILIKWGLVNPGAGNQSVNFPVAANIPVFTQCIQVSLTVADGGVGDIDTFVRLRQVFPASFTVWCSPRTTTGASACVFNYLAIGY